MTLMDSYKNLITSQHRDKPKYMATVEAILKHSEDIFSLAVFFDDNFDLDLTVGKQEDILGNIVEESRILDFEPANNLSPILDDETYRTLLKAKIAKNMWKGKIYDLKTLWNTIFGKGIYICDNQDMTIDVVIAGDFTEIEQELLYHGMIVPKPQSVRIRYIVVDYPKNLPIFSYGNDNEILGGYGAIWVYNDAYFTHTKIFGYGEETDDIGGYANGYYM